MKKIGLFYSPAKGATEKVAQKVADAIGREHIDLIEIRKDTSFEEFNKYDKLVFGLSTVGRDTWDSSYSKIGWDFVVHRIKDMNFSGKTIAMFGLGNQIMYGDHFADSLGVLGENVKQSKATIVGHWPCGEYEFISSLALVDEDTFIGLAIDEDNEPEKTDDRIARWANIVRDSLLA